MTRSHQKAPTGATAPPDAVETTPTHPSTIITTTIGLEALPLELLAAIADFVREYPFLSAMMLVSHRLRDGVSLSRQWRIANEVFPVVNDIEERRKILFDREETVTHASRHGNTRCLRYVQLTREEAYSLCLPLVCLHGHLESLRYLMTTFDIKEKITCNSLLPASRTIFGTETPLQLVCKCPNGLPLLKYFHKKCGVTADDVLAEDSYSLLRACQNGCLPVVQYLHTAFGLTPDDARMYSNASLCAACEHGHLPVVQYLHTAFGLTGDDARDDDNYSLQLACENGHISVVHYLYTAFGLTADDARTLENSSLQMACLGGYLSVVQFLLTEFGLTVDDARDCDNIALQYACTNGHLPVVHYLHTAFGLTVDDARADGNASLQIACENGHLPVVQYLHVAFGLTADNARDRNNASLQTACKNSHLPVVQYLMTDFGLGLGDLVKACAELDGDALTVFNSMRVVFM